MKKSILIVLFNTLFGALIIGGLATITKTEGKTSWCLALIGAILGFVEGIATSILLSCIDKKDSSLNPKK